MSKHTSKYYQLVKILRAEKQMTKYQHMLREQRAKIRLDKANMLVHESGISNIIDLDNSKELDDQDIHIIKKQEIVYEQETQIHDRLWQHYKEKSKIMRQSDRLLPMQQKINQLKDQKLLDNILEEQDRLKDQKSDKLERLCDELSHTCEQLSISKKQLHIFQSQIDQCDKQLVKLKADFDKEDKNLHERSNKFKEEKSKDIMIKNINKEDLQMRNVMMSRIKLNQELDFSFQLQRRKAFNQAKSGIVERKKTAQEQLNKQKGIYEKLQAKELELEKQKKQIQAQVEIVNKETIFFLKSIIKKFGTHSRGVKWIVDRLLRMDVTITKQDFPQQLSNQDKVFLEELFKQTVKYNTERSSIFSKQKNFDQTVSNNSIISSRIIRRNSPAIPIMRMDHNLAPHNQYQAFMERTLLRPNKQVQRNKTMVYFDIENNDECEVRGRAVSDIKHFNIQSSSLKKIYKYTGQVIADRIKKSKWHYQSCKQMNFTTFDNDEISAKKDKAMKDKLRQTFMNVRQTPKRNYLKKFVFGEQDKK